MERFIFSQSTLDIISDLVSEKVVKRIEALKQKEISEKLISRSEARKVFQPQISTVTLDKWTREGRLQSHRLGGRVFYKLSELLNSVQTLKKYKKTL